MKVVENDKITDEQASPLMWFLLEVFAKKVISPRHEITRPVPDKKKKATVAQ